MLNKTLIVLIMILGLTGLTSAESPQSIKVYVAEVNAIGNVKDVKEIKDVIKTLLQSKVSKDGVVSVDNEREADFLIKSTYVVYSGAHNLDVAIMNQGGQTLKRVSKEFMKDELLLLAIKDESSEIIEIVKRAYISGQPAVIEKKSTNRNVSPVKYASEANLHNRTTKINFDGLYNYIQPVKNGFVLASTRSIYLVVNNKKVTLKNYKVGSSIIYLESYNQNGKDYIITTRSESGEILTDLYRIIDGKLIVDGANLPYFVRYAVSPNLTNVMYYVQEQGQGEQQFFGGVFNAELLNGKMIKGKEINLPRYANIYNFSYITTKNNECITIVIDENGYIIAYDVNNKLIWKSGERFGGTELSYQVKDLNNLSVAGRDFRVFFVDKRIYVLTNNNILVVKNDGGSVFGDLRTYKKGYIASYEWIGSEFAEVWKTNDSNYYISDYFFDNKEKELYELKIKQRQEIMNDSSPKSEVEIISINN